MSSEEKNLNKYVELYGGLGWDSLVCHSQFLNMFFPDKATALAVDVVLQLVEELKVRPCPVVFASFSGGPKACKYKILQIIDDKTNSFVKMVCLTASLFASYLLLQLIHMSELE
uniref:Uncharacterized protein n=1 Tax=Kalanchoe fedtschenkoi TaxID=63787 RepID=A0A7N0ZQ83_KALFE